MAATAVSPAGFTVGGFFARILRSFPGSSMVERLPVKERVVGSNPTRGAELDGRRRKPPFRLY